MIGLLIFGTGSVWSAFASSANILIAARVLMGVGGAFIMPSTLSITTNVFSGKERAKAIGALISVGGLGIVLGPLTGGWLLEHFSWGTIFLINAPIILITFAGAIFLVSESKDPAASRIDVVGALLSIASLTALLYGIIEIPTYGLSDRGVLTSFITAPVLLTCFILWEVRSYSPMLDVKLFANLRFSAASIALTLASFALAGAMFFLTQYLQFVLGYSPLEAGLRFILLSRANAGHVGIGSRNYNDASHQFHHEFATAYKGRCWLCCQ